MTSRTDQIYVATSNAGKLRDFALTAESFAGSNENAFTLLPLPGLEAIAAPDENADTFKGNAVAKAVYYSLCVPGALVIVDDSGLKVDALNGAPGVYSARYAERGGAAGRVSKEATGAAGNAATRSSAAADAANNAHLLAELARVLAPAGLLNSIDHRRACYCCVLAAARNGSCLATADGVVEGRLLLAPRGEGGFGYDPLFYLPLLGRTMAELDAGTRLALSHRGAALQSLLPKLANLR